MTKAASIKELLAQAQDRKTVKPTKCHTCRWLTTLEPDDAQAVQEAIFSGEWHSSRLIALLKPMGLDVDPGALNHHRKKQHQVPTS
jgi:hypothetical protein